MRCASNITTLLESTERSLRDWLIVLTEPTRLTEWKSDQRRQVMTNNLDESELDIVNGTRFETVKNFKCLQGTISLMRVLFRVAQKTVVTI